jgi:hypothetical protein
MIRPFVNVAKAVPDLTWNAASSPRSFSGDTETATNSSPMSEPATSAQSLKKAW